MNILTGNNKHYIGIHKVRETLLKKIKHVGGTLYTRDIRIKTHTGEWVEITLHSSRKEDLSLCGDV